MAHFLPSWAVRSVCALPPGIDHFGDCAPPERGTLRLAYVGAVGANYRIHGLLEALADLRGVALDMSIPAPVWKSHSAEYSHFLGPSIRLHHLRHDEIGSLYSAAHVGTLIVEASEYWTFAVPAKLFEYIGHGMAVIASSGTLAARLVEDLGVGWVVDPTVASLRALLEYLRDTPEDIETCRRASRAIRADHTWESRVRTVVQELTAGVRQSDDPGARS